MGLVARSLLPFCNQLLGVGNRIVLRLLHFFFQLADEVLADLGLLGVDGGFESVGAAALECFDARLQRLRFGFCSSSSSS